ncbi:MAG: hypothetical protein ACP5KV_05135 [Candidatus Methanomethylicaceae archaeon]
MSSRKEGEPITEEERIRNALLSWFREHGRTFPWREGVPDPYKILVTELLLQKTKAEAVAEIWSNFFKAFPTVKDLSSAKERDVLEAIKALGLAYRAERLIALSRQIVEKFSGEIPSSFYELLRLRGVGPYIASAVLCFAYGKPEPIVDVNVMRLINRFRGYTDEKSVRDFISKIISSDCPKELNWAILDISATICKPKKPDCPSCPLDRMCLKADAQMSKWRIMRKNIGEKIRLSLQPYSVKKKSRAPTEGYFERQRNYKAGKRNNKKKNFNCIF